MTTQVKPGQRWMVSAVEYTIRGTNTYGECWTCESGTREGAFVHFGEGCCWFSERALLESGRLLSDAPVPLAVGDEVELLQSTRCHVASERFRVAFIYPDKSFRGEKGVDTLPFNTDDENVHWRRVPAVQAEPLRGGSLTSVAIDEVADIPDSAFAPPPKAEPVRRFVGLDWGFGVPREQRLNLCLYPTADGPCQRFSETATTRLCLRHEYALVPPAPPPPQREAPIRLDARTRWEDGLRSELMCPVRGKRGPR